MEKEKAKIAKDIANAWKRYIDLLKFSPLLMKKHFEQKYHRLYSKMLRKRIIDKRVKSMKDVISDKKITKREVKANNLREYYLESTLVETSRGIISHKAEFLQNHLPILFEERWLPSPTRINIKSAIFGGK